MHRTPSRVVSSSLLALGAALVASNDCPAQLVIGGFETTRGGALAISGGGALQTVRSSISAAFPGVTYTGSATLTSRYLATIDILVVFSPTGGNSAISPLTPAEQASVAAFVQAGGRVLVCADNDTYAGSGSDAANESVLDPFSIDITGTGAPWAQGASVTNPSASPVTNGPFGQVTNFSVGWSGWFNGVPSTAQPIATINQSGLPGLLVIPYGASGPGSGAVVAFADSTMFYDGFFTATSNNDVLLRNAIAYLIQPCVGDLDGSGAVDAADLAVLLGSWGTAGAADLDASGTVDAADLGVLLGNWGPC
ncbi:MAG: hypothetical protein U0572_15805 [Phycisphaerales bacterium]